MKINPASSNTSVLVQKYWIRNQINTSLKQNKKQNKTKQKNQNKGKLKH